MSDREELARELFDTDPPSALTWERDANDRLREMYRAQADCLLERGWHRGPTVNETSDEIARLTQENERLRAKMDRLLGIEEMEHGEI